MTDRKKAIQKLYQDAVELHLIHTGQKMPKQRFDDYWEDADLTE